MANEVKNHVLALLVPFPNLISFFPPGTHLSFLGVAPCMVLMGSGHGAFGSQSDHIGGVLVDETHVLRCPLRAALPSSLCGRGKKEPSTNQEVVLTTHHICWLLALGLPAPQSHGKYISAATWIKANNTPIMFCRKCQVEFFLCQTRWVLSTAPHRKHFQTPASLAMPDKSVWRAHWESKLTKGYFWLKSEENGN